MLLRLGILRMLIRRLKRRKDAEISLKHSEEVASSEKGCLEGFQAEGYKLLEVGTHSSKVPHLRKLGNLAVLRRIL